MENWEKAKHNFQIQFVDCRRDLWGEILNPLSRAIGFSETIVGFLMKVVLVLQRQGKDNPDLFLPVAVQRTADFSDGNLCPIRV